jgi:hypothetical protein
MTPLTFQQTGDETFADAAIRVRHAIAVTGGLLGLYLLVMLVRLPITVHVVEQHILHDSLHFYARAMMAL